MIRRHRPWRPRRHSRLAVEVLEDRSLPGDTLNGLFLASLGLAASQPAADLGEGSSAIALVRPAAAKRVEGRPLAGAEAPHAAAGWGTEESYPYQSTARAEKAGEPAPPGPAPFAVDPLSLEFLGNPLDLGDVFATPPGKRLPAKSADLDGGAPAAAADARASARQDGVAPPTTGGGTSETGPGGSETSSDGSELDLAAALGVVSVSGLPGGGAGGGAAAVGTGAVLGAGEGAGAAAQGFAGELLYFNDFEGAVGNEWDPRPTSVTPATGRRFLGEFGSETVRLTLNNLPAHSSLQISFDLFLLRSWDGNNPGEVGGDGDILGPDGWSLSVHDGPELLNTTFSNHAPGSGISQNSERQAYPDAAGVGDNPALTGAAEVNTLGYFHPLVTSAPMDSVYHLTFTFPHDAQSVTFNFAGSLLQALTDESWGLDNVRVGPLADLDIDSDNNRALNDPNRDANEDRIEDDASLPGKYVEANTRDKDNDTVPDFADGFDRDGRSGTAAERRDDRNAAERFTPLVLDVPQPFDVASVRFKFRYAASDPNGVTVDVDGVYVPAEGHLRIWTRRGNQERDKVKANDGGDYVAPSPAGGPEEVYRADHLRFDEGSRTKTLFVEGVRPSANLGDQRIVVDIDPDGDGPAVFEEADAARVTVFGASLTAAHANEAQEETPGAPVMLNDDNDNTNFYPDPVPPGSPAGVRPFEPAFDLDEIANVAGEDDLMRLTLDVQPRALAGNAVLRLTQNPNRIRVWTSPTKGGAAAVLLGRNPTAGMPAIRERDFAVNMLPQDLYVEGLDIGLAALTLSYEPANGVMSADTVEIRVVSLIETQVIGAMRRRRVVNRYDTDVRFEVEGGTNDFEYRWDLNGDGDRDMDQFERGVNDRIREVRYGPAESATTVQLDRVAANRRQTYDVSVQLTGGLVLRRRIRVALDAFYGTALTGVTAAQRHAEIAALGMAPAGMQDTPAGGVGVMFSQPWFAQATTYAVTLPVNANRVQYATGPLTAGTNAVTVIDGASAGAARRVFVVIVGSSVYDTMQTREDVIATLNHEFLHVLQELAVRNDANSVWRRLDTALGFNGYASFAEAEGHHSEVLDANIGWFHLFGNGAQDDLVAFRNHYNTAIGLVPGLPAGATRTSARQLMQNMYRTLPFDEMKRRDYDFSVRAPQ